MISRFGNLLLANSVVWVVGLLVAAAVVGAGLGVRSISDRADRLREAEARLAKLENLASGLTVQVETALDGAAPDRADIRLHREIANAAREAAREVEERWRDPLVDGIEAPVMSLAASAGNILERAWGRGGEGVQVALERLAARGEALTRRLEAAGDELRARVARTVRETRLLGYGLSAAVALSLLALIVAVGALRNRARTVRTQREAAELGARRLQSLVRHGSDLIIVLGPDGTIKYEAGAIERTLGHEPGELEGRRLSEWLHPDDVELLSLLAAVEPGESPARELRLRHRDGSYRTCEARATSLRDEDLWDGVVLNIWDVSERKQLEQRLREQAFHDDLTSLPNRVLFNERLEHALVRGARAGTGVSVLLIDLDDFKSINDSLGHPAGDELLRRTARRLDEAVRGADTVARLGGDEFAVILDDTDTVEADREVAWRILAALNLPVELGGRSFPISASIGIARAEAGEGSVERLVRDADLAMYAAKAERRGSFAVYRDDMHLASKGRLQLKADLWNALAAGNQLELHYQPVVRLADGGFAGCEALLRWNHPTRGLVLPHEFVPLAEESEAIVAIGGWVLRRACVELGPVLAAAGPEAFVSVNVAPRQLQDDSLLIDVDGALAASGLEPRRLVLELTESQLMSNVERAVDVLSAVRERGVRIAVDDFGTGYSSLGQLERLPVDVLKVDREFTGRDGSDRTRLLRAVIEIGNSLQLETIAEGVETSAQRRQLRALGYSLGQGFLFSPPVPGEELAALLAAPVGSRVNGASGVNGATRVNGAGRAKDASGANGRHV